MKTLLSEEVANRRQGGSGGRWSVVEERRSKLNCWEFKKCGRQPQGHREKELGLCPAAVQGALDDVHEGTNGGRACWVVSGTFCAGQVQGTFAQKFKNCERCDFYQLVRGEEGPNFVLSAVLLGKLRP